MKKRSFLIFSGITAAVAVAAFVAQTGIESDHLPTGGKKFFPGFETALNKAGSVTIAHKGKSFTLENKGGTWTVKEKHGYPARFDRVKKALVGLSELRSFEAKTRDPKRLKKLELEDPPGGKDSNSRRLTVKDTAGKVLANLVLGKKNNNSAVFGQEMVYVRRAGEKQAWLALGNPDVAGDVLDWTRKDLLDIAKERVKETVLMPAKGEQAVITRDKPADKDFGVKDVPEGHKEKSKLLIGSVPGVLKDFELEDVRPAKDIDFVKNAAGRVRFQTFDGIVITMTMAKEKKDIWLTVSATFDAAKAVKPDPKNKKTKIKSAADAKKEAAEIATRTKGWAYKVSTNNQRFLQWKKADLLIKLKKKTEKKEEKKGEKKDDKKPN